MKSFLLLNNSILSKKTGKFTISQKVNLLFLDMNYNDPSEEQKNRWYNDADNWVWGMFYYNREDKRLWVPRKIKEFGWTTNFANPNATHVMIALIIFMLIFTVLYR